MVYLGLYVGSYSGRLDINHTIDWLHYRPLKRLNSTHSLAGIHGGDFVGAGDEADLGLALVEALGTKAYKYLAPDHWSGDVETPVPVTFLHTHDYGFDHQPDYPSFE